MDLFFRILAAISLVHVLVACNGPSPGMIGAPGVTVTSGGAPFNVFIRGGIVEAVRTNFEYPANVRTVFPRALTAMEEASGCLVREGSMTGDAALIRAKLYC